jgi:hypothetical protein
MPDPATLARDIVSGMREWRATHPTATFREIEAAVTERLAPLQAALLQEAATAAPTATWDPATPPRCPQCGAALRARGVHTRHLHAPGGQDIALTRQYATCPACAAGLSPPG